ncbi:CHAT domain-containing protein [Streptomyces lincolnensis]|uniref:CHAT domain-containing tetratricopeptide repeat protein n=1 Tax=Streptomyces lincolnensis TaxID=1915 RepID=UPI001E3B06BD|nr:CHAT domain-containing protein [Streptomyces lincolnensis]MCD7442259.1 CHAT domain-containing protein [Streptomyces lincolnensis]
MDYEPFEQCVEAFVRRDYPAVVKIAMGILQTGVSLGMAQLFLISVRRLGISPDDQTIARTLRNSLDDPWESALLDVTLGRREPASVIAEADGALQRCQALCYVGTHLITTGDLDGGRRQLRECLDLGVECMESLLASMDTELARQWSQSVPEVDKEINRLQRSYHVLRSNAHHEQSIHVADLILALVVGSRGRFHPETGRCLNELAMAYAATGDWQQAEPYLAEALQLTLLFDSVPSETYAVILDNLAQAKGAQGQFEASEKMHRAALEAFAGTVGTDHPSYATCLGNLARMNAELGQHAEAERLYQQAIDLRRRLFGTDDVRYIGMVDGLAQMYVDLGELGTAEARVRETADIVARMKGTDGPEYGSRLKQLGDLYYQMGRYPDSVDSYRRAYENERRRLGSDHPTTIDTQAKVALGQKLTGQLGEAMINYQVVMAHQSGVDLALTTHNLAMLHLGAGDRYLARRYAKDAIERHRTAGLEDSLDHALLLHGQASVDSYDGRYDDAENTLRRAMDLIRRHAGRDTEHYANACDRLAQCLIWQQRYDAADELLRTSLRLREKLTNDPSRAVDNVSQRGTVQLAKGRWDSAEALFRRALEVLHQNNGKERTTQSIELLRELGLALTGMGREREAIDVLLTAEGYQDSVIQQKAKVTGISPRSVTQPVELLNILGRQPVQPPGLVSQLLEVVWRRKGIVAEADYVRRREEIHSRQHDRRDVLEKLDRFQQALQRGEMPTKADVEEVIDGSLRHARHGMYPDLQTAHRDLHAHLMEGWPERGDLSREEWLEQLTEYSGRAGSLMGKRDSLESDLRILFHGDGWLGEVLPRVTLEAVRSRLPEESALVEFLRVPTLDASAVLAEGGSRWGSDRYYAFVVTPDPDSDVRLIDLGAADSVDTNLALLKRGITRDGRARDIDLVKTAPDDCARAADSAAHELRRTLLDPLGIADRARLFMAPDAQLYTLPFEILPLDDGRLVIDAHEIAYLTTGRDLIPVPRATTPEPPGPPVVIADPDYDLALDTITDPAAPEEAQDARRAADLHFARLPGTHTEGRHIADLLGVTAWLGADAVEGPLKQQRSPVVLHIASHGYFLDDDQPTESDPPQTDRRAFSTFPAPLLNSGLALAGANTWLRRGHLPDRAEDGLLTAADLATMDLSGTELVVLSACDTGRGLVSVGQGVYGLRRSVGVAGARTLVMSLWQVPDRETQELMEDFYGRLTRGEPRGSAFRAARLAMRARKPDPYYWGAFICQGDPGPMPAHFLGDIDRSPRARPGGPTGRPGQ